MCGAGFHQFGINRETDQLGVARGGTVSQRTGDELSSAACVELAMKIFDMIMHGVRRASDAISDDTD